MGRVRARIEVAGLASDAEALWYDHRRWPTFVDGLKHVARIDGDWPHEGARVVWDHEHGGAGRVMLRVESYEPRAGQTVRIEDERVSGVQEVRFRPYEGGCRVELERSYEPKDPRLRPALLDRLVVRRSQRETLERTLRRFAAELAAERDLPL
jgi:Polyketide cyclase / dehydrase and lipid transport